MDPRRQSLYHPNSVQCDNPKNLTHVVAKVDLNFDVVAAGRPGLQQFGV